MKLCLATSLAAAAAFLISYALDWLALIKWKHRQADHWTIKARRLFPLRASALLNPLILAAVAAVTVQSLKDDLSMPWLPPTLAALLGASLSGYFTAHRIWPQLTFSKWVNDCALRLIFFQGGLIVMAVCLASMPARIGTQTWIVATAYLVVMLSLLLGLGFQLVRRLNLVEPAPADVESVARRAAEQAGAELRRVWTTRGYVAQAYALLPMRDILLSQGLVETLSRKELETVCAHEAAHLTESRWVFAGRIAGALALFPLIFLTPAISNFGLVGLLVVALTTFLILSLSLRLSRRMEKRADAAAGNGNEDAEVFARALEKIYEFNLIPATMPRKRQSHPDLYDRMLAAGVTPAYERPRPPRGMPWTTILLIAAMVFAIVRMSVNEAPAPLSADHDSQPGGMRLLSLEADAARATNTPPDE